MTMKRDLIPLAMAVVCAASILATGAVRRCGPTPETATAETLPTFIIGARRDPMAEAIETGRRRLEAAEPMSPEWGLEMYRQFGLALQREGACLDRAAELADQLAAYPEPPPGGPACWESP